MSYKNKNKTFSGDKTSGGDKTSNKNELIDDLSDIIGSYTDEKDYQTLIKYDPKTFTKDKLVKNLTNDIPLDELVLFSKAYGYAKRWLESRAEYHNIWYKTVKPIELVSLFIKYIRFYGDIDNVEDFSVLDHISYKRRTNNDSEDIYLVDEIEDTAFMSSTDIMENIDVENIYENSSSKFKNKFEKITGINISDMEEDENLHDHIISKLSSELRSQIIKLMDDDPNFHPLKNFKEYQKKLLDLVLVNYVKEDKE